LEEIDLREGCGTFKADNPTGAGVLTLIYQTVADPKMATQICRRDEA
jgi:hypothetical protein